MQPRLGTNGIMIALAVGAAVCFAIFVLYGAWIDGRRQKIRAHGQHPVTGPFGEVKAGEVDAGEITAGEDEDHV